MDIKVTMADDLVERFEETITATLYEIGGELEAQVKKNTPVGKYSGGDLRQNWTYEVDAAHHRVTVGNPLELAIWVEYGTGDYALKGDGVKGGWYIPVGNGEGQMPKEVAEAYGMTIRPAPEGSGLDGFVFTRGMRPKRILHNTMEKMEPKMQKAFKARLKRAME